MRHPVGERARLERAMTRARSASSSMPTSARPGRSSGSSSPCWPKRASTQAWKRVPNRAAGRGRPGHRAGQLGGEARRGRRAAGANAVADRLDGSGTAITSGPGPRGPRRAAARARRPTRCDPGGLGPCRGRGRRRAGVHRARPARRPRADAAASAAPPVIGQGRAGPPSS